MSRYGKYFLQHLLCLEDAFCHYYVQDDSWGRQEILDVEYVVFDWDEDAEALLVQCAEYDSFTTLNRLRSLLAEDCLTQYQVHRMNDRQVVHTAAREISIKAFRMVIEPKIGWAVRVDPNTEEPVQPIAVEAAPDIDDMLDELRVELDGLVDEQKKNYRLLDAKLADMSEADKAALYGKKAGSGLYNATIGSLVDLVKAAPGLAKKAASAWWRFKTYPLRLAQITAQAIKTGSMDPLQKEIKAKLGPVVRGARQLKHFTSMTMVLLGEEATREMLLDFVDRYWDHTHPLEKTELGAEAASEVVINILLAIFTAGVGVAANVAAKSGRLIKVAKMLERMAGVLKRMKSLGRLPKKRKGVGKKGPKAKATSNTKAKGPEHPSTPAKKAGVDDGKKKGYSEKSDKKGPKTTTKKNVNGKDSRTGRELAIYKKLNDYPNVKTNRNWTDADLQETVKNKHDITQKLIDDPSKKTFRRGVRKGKKATGFADVEIPGVDKKIKAFSGELDVDGYSKYRDDSQRMLKTFDIGKMNKASDVEAKILEDVFEQTHKNPNVKGKVRLFVDRTTCESCQNVVRQFAEKRPNIMLEIVQGPK